MRNILWSTFAYVAALGMGVGVVYGSTLPKYRLGAFDALLTGLIALQGMLFFFYGLFSIAAGVKGDLNGGMIESHRLMPISAGGAVMGYLLGAPVQAYALFLVNFCLGLVMYALVPRIWVAQDQFILFNFMLLVLGVFFFSIGIFWNLLGRNVGRYLIGFLILYWFSRGELLSYLPGLVLLFPPSLWTFRALPPTWVFVVAGGAELVVAGILLIAAAHKYRWPGKPAFTPELALALLMAMAAIFGTGIGVWDERNNPGSWFYRDISDGAQFVCSISVVAWIGMVVGVSSMKYSPRLWTGIAAALACSVAVCAMMVEAPMRVWSMMGETALIVVIFELTLLFLLRFFYSRSVRGGMWTFVVLIAMWFVPFVADAMRYSASAQDGAPRWTQLASLSPFGAMFLIWKMEDYPVVAGIGFQLAVLVGAVLVNLFFVKGEGVMENSAVAVVGRGGEFVP